VTPRPAKIQCELGQHGERLGQIGTEGNACHLEAPPACPAPARTARTSTLSHEPPPGTGTIAPRLLGYRCPKWDRSSTRKDAVAQAGSPRCTRGHGIAGVSGGMPAQAAGDRLRGTRLAPCRRQRRASCRQIPTAARPSGSSRR
jgi:hypothetical protein